MANGGGGNRQFGAGGRRDGPYPRGGDRGRGGGPGVGVGGGGGESGGRPSFDPPPEATVRAILAGDGVAIVAEAQRVARALVGNDLKNAQIRSFYGPLVRLRDSRDSDEVKRNQLHLMRPRLAYLESRTGGGAKPLWVVFERLIPAVTQPDHLEHLVEFAEAVVAYHSQKRGHSDA
jgi:CRISPR type III-A-associated protein Csm2